MTERKLGEVSRHQQLAMTSINNLAVLLDEVVNQLQQQMMQNSGQCKKPGSSKPSSSSMNEMQKKLAAASTPQEADALECQSKRLGIAMNAVEGFLIHGFGNPSFLKIFDCQLQMAELAGIALSTPKFLSWHRSKGEGHQ